MAGRRRLPPDEAVDPLDGWSLPAWTYSDPDFFEAERAHVFASAWQVVCHQSDIPQPGDWRSIEIDGESVVVVRQKDLDLRAFANVCRHRGSRILDGDGGHAKKIACPYHAWTYEIDGTLTGVPDAASYPGLEKSRHGLANLPLETWRGFVFVRLADEGPSVREMMAPFEDMIAPYRFEEMRALGRVTLRPRPVNWKTIGDNYSDGLHIPVAHPGLTRLFGSSYGVETCGYVDRMWGKLESRPSANWSERHYQRLLPGTPHLPESARRQWLYFKLWPNVAFDIYPDQVDFMQWQPLGPGQSVIREISYALPDDRREMRAARYLNWRINRQVNAEDTRLIERVQQGMESRTFAGGPLSEREVCLRSFCRRMRSLIPEARQQMPPQPGWSRREGR